MLGQTYFTNAKAGDHFNTIDERGMPTFSMLVKLPREIMILKQGILMKINAVRASDMEPVFVRNNPLIVFRAMMGWDQGGVQARFQPIPVQNDYVPPPYSAP